MFGGHRISAVDVAKQVTINPHASFLYTRVPSVMLTCRSDTRQMVTSVTAAVPVQVWESAMFIFLLALPVDKHSFCGC